MCARLAATVAILSILVLTGPSTAVGHARSLTVAQEQEEEEPGAGQEGQDQPEAETGAEEGQTEEAAEEEGPPWTYQMARLSLVLLALLALGIGAAYYRFVVMRQRGEV